MAVGEVKSVVRQLTEDELEECIRAADRASAEYRRTPWSRHLATAINKKMAEVANGGER